MRMCVSVSKCVYLCVSVCVCVSVCFLSMLVCMCACGHVCIHAYVCSCMCMRGENRERYHRSGEVKAQSSLNMDQPTAGQNHPFRKEQCPYSSSFNSSAGKDEARFQLDIRTCIVLHASRWR